MYIQYEHTQWYFTERRNEKEYGQNDSLIKRVPDKLPKPEFMPSKLVRISDMKVVHGSRVNEGYCALSYSWNQSGGILRQRGTRKCKRIDEGHHKIIFPSTNSFSPSEEKTPDKNTILPEDVIPYARTHKNAKLDKIRRVLTIIHNVNYLAKKEEYNRCVKYVKFEGLIRQICRQFNIKYIWYDQVCINQNDKLEKQREIRNMHHIFSNAYCTVALVPEFYLQQNKNQYPNYKDFEITKSTLHQHEWFKRLWTLEEAIKSKRLLFIGRNIHVWGQDLVLSELHHLNHSSEKLSVQQILHDAHRRKSTRDHDRVFALIHLFPNTVDQIKIDYDQSVEDLMVEFYGLLAKIDIGVLAFTKASPIYESAIIEFNDFLPSWTGVDGEHHRFITTPTTFQSYNVSGNTLKMKCTYVTNSRSTIDSPSFDLRHKDLPPFPDNDNEEKNNYYLCIHTQLPGRRRDSSVIIRLSIASYKDIFETEHYIDRLSKDLYQLSRLVTVKKEHMLWYNFDKDGDEYTELDFTALTEDMDDPSSRYVLLAGIPFEERVRTYEVVYYPVIKKKDGEDIYKAIGTCWIRNSQYLFSGCNLPKKSFKIQ